MSDNHDNILAQFQDITGCDIDRARFFLDCSDWNLTTALGTFYENEGTPEADAPEPVVNPGAAGRVAEPTGAKPTPPRKPPSGTIRTLESDDDNSDSDMEEGQAFYAGGSETSGQQILGPPKKKDGGDFVKEMFKKAREHGAEAVDPSSMGASSSNRFAFTGTGFRLGSTDVSSTPVGQSTSGGPPPKPREFALKMWRNGFSIDDGEIRSYEDPQNREFLVSVMAGRIPRELFTEAKGGEVHVNMEDHKDEDYKKPKATVKPFQGSGHVLGSVVPQIVSHSTPSASNVGMDQYPQLEENAQREIAYNPTATNTVIQVRLPDGGRLKAKLNTTHTVADLRRYILISRPHLTTFSMMTTFPNKELTDDSLTLQEAGIIGAAILLRSI